MLVIRLRRIGRKHDPHYRVVVTEHTAPVQGKFIAEIGHHHPKSKETVIDQALFMEWLGKGAKPSNTVAKLAERQGMKHKQIVVKQYQGKPKKKAQEAAAQTEEKAKAPAEEVTATPAESVEETPEEVAEEVKAEEAVEDAPTEE